MPTGFSSRATDTGSLAGRSRKAAGVLLRDKQQMGPAGGFSDEANLSSPETQSGTEPPVLGSPADENCT